MENMITVQLAKNAPISLMAVSELQKLELVREDDEVKVTTIEYCLNGCQGLAHARGTADADGHFCDRHVHRSVHAIDKIGVVGQLLSVGM